MDGVINHDTQRHRRNYREAKPHFPIYQCPEAEGHRSRGEIGNQRQQPKPPAAQGRDHQKGDRDQRKGSAPKHADDVSHTNVGEHDGGTGCCSQQRRGILLHPVVTALFERQGLCG